MHDILGMCPVSCGGSQWPEDLPLLPSHDITLRSHVCNKYWMVIKCKMGELHRYMPDCIPCVLLLRAEPLPMTLCLPAAEVECMSSRCQNVLNKFQSTKYMFYISLFEWKYGTHLNMSARIHHWIFTPEPCICTVHALNVLLPIPVCDKGAKLVEPKWNCMYNIYRSMHKNN